MIYYCSHFQRALLEIANEPILCRGGISEGDMYVENEIMFGKGLVNAYRLESYSAIFPRIIIPIDIVEENMANRISEEVGNSLISEDGYYVINYIGMMLHTNKTTELLESERIERYIYDNLSKHHDIGIRNKILYLKKWYNSEFMVLRMQEQINDKE